MANDINSHSTDLSDLKTGNRVSIAGVITSYKDSLSLQLLDYNSLQVEGK
jgi:tartrate dehydratase beta subunit/fumarate hydratase class I family protein